MCDCPTKDILQQVRDNPLTSSLMSKEQTFEEFLRSEVHPELFPQLLDDEGPDHFDNWLGNVNGSDYLDWGNLYGKSQFNAGMKHIVEMHGK